MLSQTVSDNCPPRGTFRARSLFALACFGGLLLTAHATQVELKITAPGSGEMMPARVHLKDMAGQPVRAPGLPFWNDHFVCPGTVQLELASGNYTLEVERGPEYRRHRGSFSVTATSPPSIAVELARVVDLGAKGWWAGDLHIHRPVADIPLLLRAEDLAVGPVITWWNQQNLWSTQTPPALLTIRLDGPRFYNVMAGEDEREGGALLYFHLEKPLPLIGSRREFPSPLKFVEQARSLPTRPWIDVEKPFWWDAPTWVASGQIDSIGLANNHMCREKMYESEAWGKARDTARWPAPTGNGYWTQEIYYHFLDAGLRIPPSAGSASGVLPNPVGYNRVYVYLSNRFDYSSWWDGLRAGRSFVSNGPLLLCEANGEKPGHIFRHPERRELEIELRLSLMAQDPIRQIEVVENGEITARLPVSAGTENFTTKIKFNQSGWFLVRAICDLPNTFRFASTAPYYVEMGTAPRRVSKSSAEFFLAWVRERMGRVRVSDAAELDQVLKYHREAENFWRQKVAEANAN